ncbi:hypothetical protein B8W99_13320 [Peribacillus simplex]|nr:hypothetical protein B8W99_13320 [Peribacillus simplex]
MDYPAKYRIKDTSYLFSYLPIISILLFRLSFAIYGEMQMLKLFGNLGIYQGMLEFFSEAGIKLALLIVLLRGKRVPGVEI